MSKDQTTIKVAREDAEKLKELYPELRSDAYRLAALLAQVPTPQPAPQPSKA